MAEKTVKRVVTHPKFYFAVGGKLQRMEIGTELTLSESEAERLKGKVADPSKVKRLEGGQFVNKGGNSSNDKLAQDLADTKAENERLKSENVSLKKRNR